MFGLTLNIFNKYILCEKNEASFRSFTFYRGNMINFLYIYASLNQTCIYCLKKTIVNLIHHQFKYTLSVQTSRESPYPNPNV